MRRVTIFDDSTGLETSITFDDSSSGTVITSLTLATPDGSGVRSEHLLQLKEFGLTMPLPKASRGALQRPPTPSGDDGAGHGQPAPSSPPRARGRRRPPDEELRAAWKRCGGKAQRLAQLYNVPTKTAGNWIYRARKEGILPPTASRVGSTEDAAAPSAALPIP